MNELYIKRETDLYLQNWKKSLKHKPLLLRGARQVGKSFSVREFGKSFEYFLEINFEKKEHEEAKKIFARHSSPKKIIDELYSMFGISIQANKTLLFFDEIQSSPEVISSLRYFYEEMPELHVIAAGSLLEFALEEISDYGVGRLTSLFMYPLSFREYLNALDFYAMAQNISNASPQKPLSAELHKQCLEHFVNFLIIGGMPEVVSTYRSGGTLEQCGYVLDDLILALQDDFAKYKTKVSTSYLKETLYSILMQTGKKFVYSNVSNNVKHDKIKVAVDVLVKAGLIYPVVHSSGNGIPLGAEINNKMRKLAFFDTGMMQRMLNLELSDILLGDTLKQINKGDIAELCAGLELIKSMPFNQPAQLYYWQREERGSQAEIDYLIQKGADIVPIEVKAGTRGAMQSLSLFMQEKKSRYGVRTSLENFGMLGNIDIYPLYAVGNLVRAKL